MNSLLRKPCMLRNSLLCVWKNELSEYRRSSLEKHVRSCVDSSFPTVKALWRSLSKREFLVSYFLLLYTYKHAYISCWKISILPISATPLFAFIPLWFVHGDYTFRVRKVLSVNFTLFVAWNRHSSIKTWCNKYIFGRMKLSAKCPRG